VIVKVGSDRRPHRVEHKIDAFTARQLRCGQTNTSIFACGFDVDFNTGTNRA